MTTNREEEYYRLLNAGHDRRTAYVLSDENPLAAHNRLEKIKEEREAKDKEDKKNREIS